MIKWLLITKFTLRVIPKDTIDKILDAARIEEVVGDFITLKKRGVNLLGLCPFHGEKTPSFTVSPVKGIYKCFGCGKAGNAVNFIMDHESMTYPDALRFLAKKYNIEIEEKEITPEERAQINEKESLLILNSFAQKYFTENLLNTDLGRSIGYGYFSERGFSEETIRKFQLGYSPDDRHAFSRHALQSGYKADYLIKTGLSILSDKHVEGTEIKENELFDRFWGRVMFPIHNVTGRVLGFGGRILSADKKFAKYVNSPQSEIYDKSKVLYGLYFAKKAIVQEDNCFLVEGYTDVISMHQAGVENVVASSGTSLTTEQIKLIHRFTKNITILYDGDLAGIKASFRGIDMILEEGMNVKVLLFPDGDDPDSYAKKVGGEELKRFIKENANDFIRFKTGLLYEEARQDPVKKADLIRDLVESISLIPDAITRSVYVKECARMMDVAEQLLSIEVAKRIRIRTAKKQDTKSENPSGSDFVFPEKPFQPQEDYSIKEEATDVLERNLLRLLLNYGGHIIETEGKLNEEDVIHEISLAEYLMYEMMHEELEFLNPLYQSFIKDYFQNMIDHHVIPSGKDYIRHSEPQFSTLAVSILADNYQMSENWKSRFRILVEDETYNLKKTVEHDWVAYKEKRLQKLIEEERNKLPLAQTNEEIDAILDYLKTLEEKKKIANRFLGRTITS